MSVQVKGLWKRYGPTSGWVLRDVDLSIEDGEIWGVIGHNGAGKSTLLGIVSGILKPSEGSVLIDGVEVHMGSPIKAAGSGVAAVYQELSVVPTLTVADNILLGHREVHRLAKLSSRERLRWAEKVIDRTGFKGLRAGTFAGDLNFGARQQVEIARALSRDPKVLLLDEPTTGLGPEERDLLFRDLRELVKSDGHLCIMLIDHAIDEVLQICDGVTVLADGAVTMSRPVERLSREELVDAVIGGRTGEGNAAGHFESRAPMEPDRTSGPKWPGVFGDDQAGPVRETNLGLEVYGLVSPKGFCEVLRVDRGEIRGLYGFEGSGQTEVALALMGIEQAQIRQYRLDGKTLKIRSSNDASREGFAFVSGDRLVSIFANLSVLDNVLVPIISKKRLATSLRGTAHLREKALEILSNLELRGSTEGIATELSGGNQQKVVLARVLLDDPSVVIMDSPTAGVDLGARRALVAAIRKMVREGGVPVVVASSDESEILELCDTVSVVRDGVVDSEVHLVAGLSEAWLRYAAINLYEGLEPA